MGLLDRLFGNAEPSRPAPTENRTPRGSADGQAVERYRYLLRTAPPDAIEQAHREAFAQLTPEQRTQVLQELSREVPAAERANVQADPNGLARLATRAEVRQPGTLERVFGGARFGGGGGPGMGLGGMVAGSLLSSIAGTFIGTAIAHQFLGGFGGDEPHGLTDDAHANADQDQDPGQDNDVQNDDYGGGDDLAGDDFGGDDFGGGGLDEV
jgi:hypothetical protein